MSCATYQDWVDAGEPHNPFDPFALFVVVAFAFGVFIGTVLARTYLN